MRDDTRRKLDHEVRRERRQWPLAAIFVLGLGLVGTYALTPWSVRDYGRAQGVVTYAKLDTQSSTGRYLVELDVRLDSGPLVRATGLAQLPPAVGSRVELEQRSRWFWPDTYVWLAGAGGKP
jgi:hypothetical protein